ncbi:peptide chain release factor N(5)-glutamine methyltransferase [Candidatus Uhrbacteria bacterium CG_4_9_14_3_um_filter_36_7]|uniref:Peptide chain release factor N(5)-glutamine methyltransferase n=1 Tax=Candidatus Uhrbacteria bacterium CG_4_9_14_3_um_filter_36_7 TaxID=1975033 RepID=A0A2M7XIB2_9BACT|nr:MAG: peptide chain release factor N(5)-glutamine methyltransferase [Candidatus Uhrbacteria bacterium CG_4_9_14_3_um_filter_36_7]
MTVLEVLQWASLKLKSNFTAPAPETDTPLLDAELLLATAMKVQKTWLFAHFNDPVRACELELFEQLLNRRLGGEPVAYLTQKKDFFGRSFFINPFVLIPRPATETLVEEAIHETSTVGEHPLLIDIGTGSGVIAITLAAETGLPIFASDKDPHALAIAKKNAQIHNVQDFIEFQTGHLLDPLEKCILSLKERLKIVFTDLIICANLPYLSTNEWKKTHLSVQQFEPKHALEAGQDGLELYWELLHSLKLYRDHFPKQIRCLFEIGPSQNKQIIQIGKHLFPLASFCIKKDLEGHERIFILKEI